MFSHSASKKHRKLQWTALALGLCFLWTLSALGPLRTFVPHAFSLIGWPGTSRTYLIVLQNNAELRPTGGFITSFAVMKFKNGLPVGFDMQDVYGEIQGEEYISPPFPLDVLLEEESDTYPGHGFRDANINPDFPQTTEALLDFFYRTYPDVHVDGVFAVNFSVLEKLMGLYEPIDIGRYHLTQENLFDTLEAAVSDIDHHNLEALSTRKNVLSTFAKKLVVDMIWRVWQWPELSATLAQALNEKHILLYFENESLAEKMQALEWDGRYPENSAEKGQDVLAVVVANYGGMKSDRYITRDVKYDVELTEDIDETGNPIAYGTLQLTLTHHGDTNTPISGGYKGYVRAFLPLGTELIESSTGASTQEFIDGYVGWGDFVYLFPNETVTYTYRFRLSPQVVQGDRYALTLVKQPGTDADPYLVTIHSPLGNNLEKETGLPTGEVGAGSIRENLLIWAQGLSRNATVAVNVLDDETAPRIYDQTVAGLNVIRIDFAEPIDAESAQEALNYEIIDLDVNHSEVTDTLIVDSITVENGTVLLYTTGMTLQPEEHYQILLRNVRDTEGNLISPNPRTVTAVQRLE